MQRRGFRLTLLTLLLGAAIVGGLVVWSAQQRIAALDASERDEVAQLNQVGQLVEGLGAAQLAYSASPQISDGWFGHVSRLVETLEAETASLWERGSRSDEPPQHLRALLNATSAVVQATARARENLSAGSELMAADLVLAEARQSVDAMGESLKSLQASQRAVFASQRAALEQRSWTVLGGVAALWTLGLLLLVLPKSTAAPRPAETLTIAPHPEPRAPATDPPIADLSKAAELCTAISRVTSASEVPPLLARTAALIEARGIIIWIKTDGDSLTAVASHGYEPGVITRISPIPLNLHNPTTTAWHSGAMCTVPSLQGARAALATPLWGPEGCVGVLAAEMRSGEEPGPLVQSLIVVVAAQFASIMAAPQVVDRVEGLEGGSLEGSDLPLRLAGV